MHSFFTTIPAALVLAALVVSPASAYEPADTSPTDALAAAALSNLTEYLSHGVGANASSCSIETAVRRREWHALSADERIRYTDAVTCLTQLPSRHDPVLVPGAKSRYDDFVVVHMNATHQTESIHATANFLAWHRLFMAYYETALQDECGYDGPHPYWNWGKTALDPVHSPIFDGSPGSMGSNGRFAPHNCSDALGNGKNCIPAGDGGGCLYAGPFANMTINLGPIAPTLRLTGGGGGGSNDTANPSWETNVTALSPQDGLFAYNPRCLRRDVSVFVSSRFTGDDKSLALVRDSADLAAFQTTINGDAAHGAYGLHAGGHFTISGDPGGDFYTSPGDPVFYLHHAQVDRVWWIWQNLDPGARTEVVAGTVTPFNKPPSRDGLLDDVIDLGVLGPPRTIRELASSVGLTGGELCYVYE